MAQSWAGQPHTLAELARRAGISEERARALRAAEPSELPEPDAADADGRPLWWAGTIDRWCASTGRDAPERSSWLLHGRPLGSPPVELRRGLVDLATTRGRTVRAHAVVWDTEHGHLVYLSVADAGGDHLDWLAHTAAQLVEPRWWSTTAVVMQCHRDLDDRDPPMAYVYRLVGEPDDTARTGQHAAGVAMRARAEWLTGVAFDELELGVSFPVWLDGTLTEEPPAGGLATVPDRTTGWPAAQRELEAAVERGMVEDHPVAWAVLAADAALRLDHLRDAHAALVTRGPGWHLVARPEPPAPPADLERLISVAHPPDDPDVVRRELTRLRAVAADLEVDSPEGPACDEAVALLVASLRAGGDDRYVPVADDAPVLCYGSRRGEVVEAWTGTSTRLTGEDLAAALRLRRVRRLLGDTKGDVALFRDPHGRYVLVQGTAVWAEWPVTLEAVETWTDRTVVAADEDGGNVILLALTPDGDGDRVDPVPLVPRAGRDGHGYGYDGGTPFMTYQALLRCALGDSAPVERIATRLAAIDADADRGSQLWQALTTTKGPLRIPWPRLELWARADRRRARR